MTTQPRPTKPGRVDRNVSDTSAEGRRLPHGAAPIAGLERVPARLAPMLRFLEEIQEQLAKCDSFDDIVQLAPALLLRTTPLFCRVELRVTRRGRSVGSAADTRTGPDLAVVPAGRRVFTFPVRFAVDGDHGGSESAGAGASLTVFTDAPAGFNHTALVTAAILVGQVVSALTRARAQELATQLRVEVDSNRDIGIAVAMQDLPRGQPVDVLRMHSQDTNSHRRLAAVADEVRRLRGTTPEASLDARAPVKLLGRARASYPRTAEWLPACHPAVWALSMARPPD